MHSAAMGSTVARTATERNGEGEEWGSVEVEELEVEQGRGKVPSHVPINILCFFPDLGFLPISGCPQN